MLVISPSLQQTQVWEARKLKSFLCFG